MSNPDFSIVIPLFEKGATIERAIQSVLRQTYENWELLIIDDGSTDNGPLIVQSFNDKRIQLFRKKNGGVSSARNMGIELAKANLISFLDADDEWLPNYLEIIDGLRNSFPAYKFFSTAYLVHHPQGGWYKAKIRGLPPTFKSGLINNYFKIATKSDPPVCSSTVTVHKDALLKVGMFPPGIASAEDLLTWARIAVNEPLVYDTDALAIYHSSGEQRRPSLEDPVVVRLSCLLKEYPKTPGLRTYLALWYRMQASMSIRTLDGTFALRFATKSVIRNPLDVKNLYIFLLSIIPSPLGRKLDVFLRNLKSSLDRIFKSLY